MDNNGFWRRCCGPGNAKILLVAVQRRWVRHRNFNWSDSFLSRDKISARSPGMATVRIGFMYFVSGNHCRHLSHPASRRQCLREFLSEDQAFRLVETI